MPRPSTRSFCAGLQADEPENLAQPPVTRRKKTVEAPSASSQERLPKLRPGQEKAVPPAPDHGNDGKIGANKRAKLVKKVITDIFTLPVYTPWYICEHV